MRLRERLRYWFDGTMDRGTPALIGWLALASAGLIVVVATSVMLFTDEDTEAHGGWLGVAWMSLLRTLDPGTMGDDTGRPVFLALMLTVTIGGIFIVSALIGVLTTGLTPGSSSCGRAGRGSSSGVTRSSWAGRSRSSR
ncbi:hypothetical protein [Streptomyces smyrnaeus]|uniref:hypothetical protein n=1 Tax=Streptomyces smyrnaeus TaxID=1387713 RepID=UPI001FD7D104|nr:hypothetical protein [Streptomyces smyrnaeus]